MNRLVLPSLLLLASGCNFVPPRQAPKMAVPAHFKEAEGWKLAKPADGKPRGDWWSMFHDGELNAIMRSIEVSNQSLQAAAARAEQTAAVLKSAKMAFLPTAGVNGSFTRNKSGAGGGSSNINALTSGGGGAGARTIYAASGNANWEMDLWGRLRHGAKAAVADSEAANADVESTKLSLQAQAAQAYFSLRASDAQKQLLQREVANYQKSLELTKNRESQGVATKADIAQAQTQLATTRAALIETGVQRATFEHALAALTGKAPTDFGVQAGDLSAHLPSLPSLTPSTVLQRRPDIAAAERRVAAANERLGAARAAFFPNLSLSADTGWRGLTEIFTKSNNFWSLGADVAEAILDSGKRIAQKEQAMATWKESAADYRQTVLTAFQETEDQLSTLRILAEETGAQEEAIGAARENERIAKNQYEAGTLSYLNVVTAQAAALQAERNGIDLRARRLAATVALVKALGGAW